MKNKNNSEDKREINRLGVNECTICKRGGRKLNYPFEAKKFTDLL